MGLDLGLFVISGLGALALLTMGILGLMKGSLGTSVRSILGIVPIGNPKLWAVIFVIVGFMAGGFGVAMSYLPDNVSTASLMTSDEPQVIDAGSLSCKFVSAPTTTSATAKGNMTIQADTSDNKHYTIYVKNATDAVGAGINGTIYCKSDRSNIRQGVDYECHIAVDSYRSVVSTTDTTTYYIVGQDTTVSSLEGYPWRLQGYLADSGATSTAATTSSPQETTDVVFAQDETVQYVGYYFTLPGATSVNALDANSAPKDIEIICNGQTQATISIVKQSQF